MRLQIDMGRAVKESVDVTPNTTIAQVLQQVCERRKLDPTAHSLRHQRRTLQGSVTIRYSGLISNALLELVEGGEGSGLAAGLCNIALQLESGERRMAKLSNETSLLQVLEQVAPEVLVSPGTPSVVVSRPIVGLAALRSTSLRQAGVAAGSSALLRTRITGETAAEAVTPISQAAAVSAPPGPDGSASSETSMHAAAAASSSNAVSSNAVSPASLSSAAAAAAVETSPAVGQAMVPTAASLAPAAVDTSSPDQAPFSTSTAPSMPPGAEAAESMHFASITPPAETLGSSLREMLSEALSLLAESMPPSTTTTAEAPTFADSAALLHRYIRNIARAPADPKFRTIRASNASFHSRLGAYAAARQLLRLVGFEEVTSGGERAWVLHQAVELHALHTLLQLLEERANAIPAAPTAAAAASVPPTPSVPSAAVNASSIGPSLSCSSGPHPHAIDEALHSGAQQATLLTSTAGHASSRGQLPPTKVERAVESLKRQKLAVRDDLRVPRQLRILPPTAQRLETPHLADEFFELTESDLRGMAIGAPPAEAQLQTRAMRELKRLQTMREYDRALIRVRLAGGIMMQAAFHPQEPVARVLDEVRSCLHESMRDRSFYIFTTPPRTVLHPSLSLAEADLVPATTAVLGWEQPLPEELAALPADELLSAKATEMLRTEQLRERQVEYPVGKPSQTKPSADRTAEAENRAAKLASKLVGISTQTPSGGASTGSSASKAYGDLQGDEEHDADDRAASRGRSSSSTSGKEGKPKWLKL